MTARARKKLIYLLNYVHASDAQHYVHVMHLLDVLRERHGWEITLLSEKGASGVRTVFGHQVHYLSHRGGFVRFLRLARVLVAHRLRGTRIAFFRISLPPTVVAVFLGKLIGLKTVYWQSSANHDLDRSKRLLRRWIDDTMMAILSHGVNRFVTGPETMVRYYSEVYHVSDARLRLLYNDIDLRRFPRAQRERVEGDPIRVLFVHSFSPSKSAIKYLPAMIDRMNRAAQSGIEVAFDLAGEGPERGEIERIVAAAEPGVTVRLLGAVPNTDLPQHYAGADIFVMPSYREGMPRALMEAMATGLPAVSTDAGGTRDLVGSLQDQFVVSRDDPEGFADRLLTLLQDTEARAEIGEENYRFVQRYSTEAVADMYDALLTEMLA
jgi:glycosyltransferase involved in cell wall biosynthesis